MEHRVLALDLATNIGMAIGDPRELPAHRSFTLPSTGDDVGRFLDAFDIWLSDTITVERPTICAFEAPIIHAGKTSYLTARKLMCLAGHTEFVLRRRDVPCFEGNVTQVKKFFAGSGRAQKGDVMAVARRLGLDPKNDDEADAVALFAFTVHSRFPRFAGRYRLGVLGVAQ